MLPFKGTEWATLSPLEFEYVSTSITFALQNHHRLYIIERYSSQSLVLFQRHRIFCLCVLGYLTGSNRRQLGKHKKLEMVLLVYVIALTVEELSEICHTKLKDYVRKWTNWCDVIMLLM